MQKIFKIIQWLFGIESFFLALVAFIAGGILSGLFFILLGILITPIRSKLIKYLPQQMQNKFVMIGAGIVFAFAGLFSFPTTSTTSQNEAAISEPIIEKSLVTSDEKEEKVVEEASEKVTIELPVAEKDEEEKKEIITSEDKKSDDKEENSKDQQKSKIDNKIEKVENTEKQETEVKPEVAVEKTTNGQPEETKTETDMSTSKQVGQAETEKQVTTSGGGNADNFNKYDNPEQQKTEERYVLNNNTQKFHNPSCNDVKKIKPENYGTSSSSREELISQGYSPCGHCNP